MALTRKLIVFVWTAVLAGCATRAPDVSVWSLQSPHLGLPTAKTYVLVQPSAPTRDPTGVWAAPKLDLDGVMRPLIETELTDRGYAATTSHPWITVSYEILGDVAHVEAASKRLAELTTAKPIGVGSLIVDVTDPATGRVLWRGAAVGGVSTARPVEQIDERLTYAVSEIFRGFPE